MDVFGTPCNRNLAHNLLGGRNDIEMFRFHCINLGLEKRLLKGTFTIAPHNNRPRRDMVESTHRPDRDRDPVDTCQFTPVCAVICICTRDYVIASDSAWGIRVVAFDDPGSGAVGFLEGSVADCYRLA